VQQMFLRISRTPKHVCFEPWRVGKPTLRLRTGAALWDDAVSTQITVQAHPPLQNKIERDMRPWSMLISCGLGMSARQAAAPHALVAVVQLRVQSTRSSDFGPLQPQCSSYCMYTVERCRATLVRSGVQLCVRLCIESTVAAEKAIASTGDNADNPEGTNSGTLSAQPDERAVLNGRVAHTCGSIVHTASASQAQRNCTKRQ
jgi:hypothetical protein